MNFGWTSGYGEQKADMARELVAGTGDRNRLRAAAAGVVDGEG